MNNSLNRRFVSKKYFDRMLKIFINKNKNLIRQNAVLVRRLSLITSNQKHYLKTRGSHIIGHKKCEKKIELMVRRFKQFEKFSKLLRGLQLSKPRRREGHYVLKFTPNEASRLKSFLKIKRHRFPRPRQGKYFVELEKPDSETLKRLIERYKKGAVQGPLFRI